MNEKRLDDEIPRDCAVDESLTPDNGSKVVISFSISRELLTDLDRISRETGFLSRSETLRASIRDYLRRNKNIDQMSGFIQGVLVLFYDISVEHEVYKIKKNYSRILVSSVITDHGRKKGCCEVIFFKGDASEVRDANFALRSIKKGSEARIILA